MSAFLSSAAVGGLALWQGSALAATNCSVLAESCDTTFTTGSTKTTYQDTNVAAAVSVQTYSTQILGRLNGLKIYDQTFAAAYADATVQAGVTSARATITTAGGPAVIIAAPRRLSSTTSLVSSTSSSNTVVTASALSFSTTAYIGPQTLMVGDNQSQTFILIPGAIDYDTLITTTIDRTITTTTTNTTLTSEVYSVDGLMRTFGTSHVAGVEAGFDGTDRFAADLLGRADPGTAPSHWTGWGKIYGTFASQSASGSYTGDTRTGTGLEGGIVRGILPALQIGFAFNFGHTMIAQNSIGDAADVDHGQIAAYAGWRYGPLGLAVNATAGWGNTHTTVAPVGTTARSNAALWTQSGAAELGYDFAVGAFTITPNAGMSVTHIETGRFTESGSYLDLTGAASDFTRGKFWLGLRGVRDVEFRGTALSLSAYVRSTTLTGDRTVAVPVTFVSDPTVMALSGPKASALGADLGASAGVRLSPASVLSLSYDARLRQGFVAQTAAINLKVAL